MNTREGMKLDGGVIQSRFIKCYDDMVRRTMTGNMMMMVIRLCVLFSKDLCGWGAA